MIYTRILDIVANSKGVSIDTRTLNQGEVFFALKGDNFDGNKYVHQALEKGAILVISSDKQFSDNPGVIVVEDTLLTLQKIANLHRRKFKIPVIALTGTNGKTTTKELLCTILSAKFNVLCTKGNFNNHIGVPLTLLGLKNTHEMAVIEMGASALGEILNLCEISMPTHGTITSIGKAHIQGFGSLGNIIKTKLELYDYLVKNNGTFFYNENIKQLEAKIKNNSSLISYSPDDLKGNSVLSMKIIDTYPFLSIEFESEVKELSMVNTNLYGEYNFMNIVNAVKIADFFAIGLDAIEKELVKYIPDNNRSQIISWNNNQVILDAYNANPTSMLEAIKSFSNIESKKNKLLILGDMLEMGHESLKEHIEIIKYIINYNIYQKVIFIGEEFSNSMIEISGIPENIIFVKDYNEAKKYLSSISINESLILAKGSRGIETEKVFL